MKKDLEKLLVFLLHVAALLDKIYFTQLNK